jgi:hypothetical protein
MIARCVFLALSFCGLSHLSEHATKEPTPLQMKQWTKVAMCEEGGNWKLEGAKYSGALGITNVNWRIFGGGDFATTAGSALPWEQVIVAMRINRGYSVPDQNGCSGSW